MPVKPPDRLPNLLPEQGQRETCRNCGQVISYSAISETWWHLKTDKSTCEPKYAEPLEAGEAERGASRAHANLVDAVKQMDDVLAKLKRYRDAM